MEISQIPLISPQQVFFRIYKHLQQKKYVIYIHRRKKVSQRITASVKNFYKEVSNYDLNNDVKDKRPFWKNIIAVTIVILESYREKGYGDKRL